MSSDRASWNRKINSPVVESAHPTSLKGEYRYSRQKCQGTAGVFRSSRWIFAYYSQNMLSVEIVMLNLMKWKLSYINQIGFLQVGVAI